MNPKPKPSFIRSLTQKQRDRIWEILQVHGYIEASEILAKPAPEGLGLKITKGMLERYYHERADQETIAQLPELKESADAWNAFKEHATPTYFDEAAIERLKVRAFQLSGTLKDQREFTQLKGLFQIMLAFRTTQVRERIVEVRERNAVTRQNLTSAQITYMRWKQSHSGVKPKPAPKPSPAPGTHADSETENAARVIRHCGSAEDFFAQMLPLEPIGDALRRIHHEIQNGTFRPLAPGEPPRFRVVPKQDVPVSETLPQTSSETLSNPSPPPSPLSAVSLSIQI